MIPGKRYTPEVLLELLSRRWWLVLGPATLVFACVVVYVQWLPNRYQSDTLILVVPQRVPESYVRSTVTTRIEDRLHSISQQILSRTRLERVIQDFDLYADRRRRRDLMEDIVENMRKEIGVEIVKGDAFRVSFTGEDPRVVMKVTERLASFFIDESLRDREVLAEGTNRFLESQLEDARRKLAANEERLADYRRQHDGQLPTQVESNLQMLHNVQMQLQALLDAGNRDRDRKYIVERLLDDGAAFEAAATPAPLPADGRQDGTTAGQLAQARRGLEALLTRLTPQHPDVIRQQRAVAQLEQRLETEASTVPVTPARPLTPIEAARLTRYQDAKVELDQLDRELRTKANEEKRLRALIANYQARVAAAPMRESELAELMRDYDTLQQTYRTLLTKKQDSQISANLERRQIGEQFRILDPARLPEKPVSPQRLLWYGGGLLAALAAGLLLAGLFEYFDRGLRSETDVLLALAIPVIAAIPEVPVQRIAFRRRLVLGVSIGVLAIVGAAAAVAWRLVN